MQETKNLQDLLKNLPKMDLVLAHFRNLNKDLIKQIARQEIQNLRERILRSDLQNLDSENLLENLLAAVQKSYENSSQNSLQRVINATGVVLQTNLGRAVFSHELFDKITPILTAYNNLEYDLQKGARSSRYTHANTLLKSIFNTNYDFLLVNNNAAAVFLILNTFARGKEVIISRSELVEIGGEFRIHEIMNSSGAILKEVGASNKTHLRDYQNAITPQSAMIFKAHKSNFAQVGFCSEVDFSELKNLALESCTPDSEILDYYDLGSGYFCNLFGVDEPNLRAIFENPPSIFSFSGDKLLGGPQVGIIAGKSQLIARLKENHLLRAFRVDKLCIAALNATLEFYINGEFDKIPTLQMLAFSESELKARAQNFAKKIENLKLQNLNSEIIALDSAAGGGSLPNVSFASFGVALDSENLSAQVFAAKLRTQFNIIARIFQNRVLMDMRTIFSNDEDEILSALEQIFGGEK